MAASLAERKLLTDNLILYVSPNGSDESGDGTEAKPFASADYAVVWANNNCDFGEQFDLYVKLAPGSYDAIQIYGQSARQVYLVGEPENPGSVQVKVISEDAVFGLAVSFYSFAHVSGIDIASVIVTGFSHLTIDKCNLSPSSAPALVLCSNHSTVDFNSAIVKPGRIGKEENSTCYLCEIHSHIEVEDVDYEATVECDIFCEAQFLSSIYLCGDSDTKNNVKAKQLARAITQSIVCDSDFLPGGSKTANLAASGGRIDDLNNSGL